MIWTKLLRQDKPLESGPRSSGYDVSHWRVQCFDGSINSTTDKQPQGWQAIKGPPALFKKLLYITEESHRGTFVHLIFTTMFPRLHRCWPLLWGACTYVSGSYCMCVQIFSVCLSHPWRGAESSLSRLLALPALLQSQWTARAPDYSRLLGRVLAHCVCLCVHVCVCLSCCLFCHHMGMLT